MNTSKELTFSFATASVRTFIDEYNNPWFCAKDVCDSLEITWKGSDSLESIPEEWKLLRNLRTSFGEKDLLFINEAGLYQLIFRSQKPKAKDFANKVFSEVLPTIRKQGYFGAIAKADPKHFIAVSKHITYLNAHIADCKHAFQLVAMRDQLQIFHAMLGTDMPPMPELQGALAQTDRVQAAQGGAQ
jgi:prophage antirepressor-like protein